ncbi:MAG: hypothetical protein ABJN84_16410 [Flavobacteriaceae bacterium]
MWLKHLLLITICCSGITALGQSLFETGKVHDSVPVSGTKDETFALYLPKSFNPDSLSSIIFIFDPAARGARGIKPFIPAAEKYGHLVICSNNSRNGRYDRNFNIANRLFSHTFNNFLIKQNEMYLSGFSGGSRLASAIATLTNRFAGVVGCGAGFSNVREHKPSVQKYAYVGLCGDRDMNYKEMLGDKDFLSLLKFNSTLITYEDDHSWPPPKQILRAFDWLALQQLKKSSPIDTLDIFNLYRSDYKKIKEFETDGELLYASEQYDRVLKSYQGLIKMDSLRKQQKELLTSKAHKKKSTSLAIALKTEQKLSGKLTTQMITDFITPKETNFGWWEKELNKLNALADKEDVEIEKMVSRLKFDLYVRAYSTKNEMLYNSNKEQVALANRFLDLISPKKE